mmetsp:Transcript_44559/g.111953  ORF Transcript_44559/g.111953 Transcript_44559/m.111953 type:complete len:208 (-) Transcript_44559:407-1030(-)
MSSIILMTLSKPPVLRAFFPANASDKRSSAALSLGKAAFFAALRASKARERTAEVDTDICTRLALALAPGNVFLNKSNASSSLRTLIVSASATNSSARVFERSSHSAVFVLQLLSSSWRKPVSAARAASVSSLSSFAATIATPSSPICSVLASMEAVSAATSLVLAAISPSYVLMAASSVAVASAKSFAMVSPICFKMPRISPLCGA